MIEIPIYGMAGEFDSPDQVVQAARSLREYGYRRFEVYGPYPLKELDEIVPGTDPIPKMVLAAGVLGCITAWALQFYVAVIDYPTNIGGRPLNSWPAFVPIMFELSVLFAALAAFFGTLWLAGLPLLHHPVFNLKRFARASSDRFFLCIEAADPLFSAEQTRRQLVDRGSLNVWTIDQE